MLPPANSVEIFHDLDHDSDAHEAALQAIDYISSYAGEIALLNDRRHIRLSSNTDQLNGRAINWPIQHMRADINIVLTPRQLYLPDENNVAQPIRGLSLNSGFGTPNIALVSTEVTGSAQYTTVHEVGHLFNLKDSPNRHCPAQHCVMAEYAPLAIGGLVRALKETAYCSDCADSLTHTAHMRSLARIGIIVPGQKL